MDCMRSDWSRGDAESLRTGLGCLSLHGDMILFISLLPRAGSSGGQQSEGMGLKVKFLLEDLLLVQQDVRAVMRCCCLQATRDRVHSAAVLTCGSVGVEFLRGVYGLIHKVFTWR